MNDESLMRPFTPLITPHPRSPGEKTFFPPEKSIQTEWEKGWLTFSEKPVKKREGIKVENAVTRGKLS